MWCKSLDERTPRASEEQSEVRDLLQSFIAFTVNYEGWIKQTQGLRYRLESIKLRKKTAAVSAASMKKEWEKLRCALIA